MSVKSFKFVSPGVFINEIDNSQLPRLPDQLGPVIIGRAERGPAMVPVQIDSFSEFVETFGEPIAGGDASDAWRNGNRMGPTYAAYAAQAYLASSSPVTFVRLLGFEADDAGADGKAGWSVDDSTMIKIGGNPYAIIYHTSAVTVTAAGTAANKEIQITLQGAGNAASGTRETTTLTVDEDWTTEGSITGGQAFLDGNPAQLKFELKDKDGQVVNVKFSLDLSNEFDNASSTLTVGLAGGVSAEQVAAKIADAINAVGDALKLSASSSGRDVRIIGDEPGTVGAGGEIIANLLPDDGAPATSNTLLSFVTVAGTDAGADSDKVFKVSLNPNSKKYIRKAMNTNPVLINDEVSGSPEKYFLGPTFDQSINRLISDFAVANVQASPLGDDPDYNGVQSVAKAPSSPIVVGQHLGDRANFDEANLVELFQIHSLYAGEWEQKNFKISITDIAAPKNSYAKYGTFSLEVRRVTDSDSNPQVVERFTGLTLDPASPSFISAKIGDMYMVWDEEASRYKEYGEHKNQSRYIRIEVDSDVASGAANPELLPFGFKLKKDPEGPDLLLRLTTKGSSRLSNPKDAYFGVTTDKTSSSDATSVQYETHDDSYLDMVRTISTKTLVDQELFTLDFIKREGTRDAALGDEADFTGLLTLNSLGYEGVLEAGFNKFTMPLQGGTDGLDITLVEPFSAAVLDENASSQTSSAYYSVKRAIDSVSDPEFVECNMMAIPGISNPGLTGHLINVCETRADALAVIDIEEDYTPVGWDASQTEDQRLPDPDAAVSAMRDRGINSSYGCAYFPWVQVRDNISNRLLWVPPSVVAMGTMSSSAANSELWFAPAGFTRGGLTQGSAGLPVVQARYRLNSKERDALYEANINPIAQFPSEGIVIFGQKTLQVTPSALDRINVRRLMIYVKKEISRMASTLLFDQNVDTTWARFISTVEPFLTSVKARFGLTEYRVILDETTTTPELVDRNIMYAKIYLKPARAIEFIAIDFVITNSGASFDD